MVIRRLILNNFRQYIGKQIINFSTDPQRNVTVLIGINTSGKTTFVRAFEWILYNKCEFEDKVLLNKKVADSMPQGDRQEVSGTLIIEHNNMVYEITRRQAYIKTGDNVKGLQSEGRIYYLQDDGQTKTSIDSDFQSNIQSILPRSLSSYFFFGGERVGTISDRADIEESVKGLMGLNILSNAISHLKILIRNLKKDLDYSGDDKTRELNEQLEALRIKELDYKQDLDQAKDQYDYFLEEKEKYAALLRANENSAIDQRRREAIDSSIQSLNRKMEKEKKNIVSYFSDNSFAFLSIPLLEKAIRMLDSVSDSTESIPEMTASSLDYILKRRVCICGTRITPNSPVELNILKERSKLPPESIGAIVRRYRETAMQYLTSSESFFNSFEESFSNFRESERLMNHQIDEKKDLEERLIGKEDIHVLEKHYNEADRGVRKYEKEKESIQQKLGSIGRDIQNCENRLDRLIANDNKNKQTMEYIGYVQSVLDWISDAYDEREANVRNKLEEKVNYNFSKMYHGSRTISIDEKYRVKYIDVTTEESEGLKAVRSFAFVSGLVDLAKEILATNNEEVDVGPQYYPLVMDAPFSNVDEIHIRNISTILPSSAQQVIIAVMKKDWDLVSGIMSPYVGMTYEIKKDKDSKGKDIDTMSHIKEV